ncbi:hypothetical protein H4R19_000376 [Coemansia spiralis]|nr:hypothetical protein H4R19_000376 [Coemansia spiralis]
MEDFVNSVKSAEFPLHPLDTQAAFLNIPYHFFYGNTTGTADFMPSAQLKTGFYRALQQFPILVGQLRSDGGGRTSVVVRPKLLNMPEYVESASDVGFEELQATKFHNSAWPAGLSTAGAITKAGRDGRIKLLTVHVVRLRNNSGVVVFVNMPHYVVDGTGFFAFVRLWADHCRAERRGDSALAAEAGARPLCFDRALIGRSLPADRKPLDADTVGVYTGFSPVAAWLAWLSPATRGRVLDVARFSTNVVSHTFRVPRDELQKLCQQVAAHLPRDHPVPVDTHVLAAVIAMTVAGAHRKCREENEAARGVLGRMWGLLTSLVPRGERIQPLHLLADVRHSLGIEDQHYMGNGLLPHNRLCAAAVLEAPINAATLAAVTEIATAIYASADAPLVASFIDLFAARPACFTRPMVYLARHPTALVITNETGFPLYAPDFGDGVPEWVCTIPAFAANFIGLLANPAGPSQITVNVTLKAPVMKHVLASEFWRDLATIVY